MFYKVMLGDKVVDVLDRIIYVMYQEKHDTVLMCEPEIAQAILSSDCMKYWHISDLYDFKPDNTEYTIIEISKTEYNQLKGLAR